MVQTDDLAQLLIEKGFITLEEYDTKLKQAQYEYMSKQSMKSCTTILKKSLKRTMRWFIDIKCPFHINTYYCFKFQAEHGAPL